MKPLKLDKSYYSGTRLKIWNLHDVIRDRVNRESEAMYHFTPKPPTKPILDVLQPSVGLANFYKGIIKFVMDFRP